MDLAIPFGLSFYVMFSEISFWVGVTDLLSGYVAWLYKNIHKYKLCKDF